MFVVVCVDCLFILCFKKGALLYYSIVLEPRVCGLGQRREETVFTDGQR